MLWTPLQSLQYEFDDTFDDIYEEICADKSQTAKENEEKRINTH